MKQARVIISGSVQAVGYRFFVRSWARQYDITGWVRNIPDGGVEAVFQGEKKNIDDLIAKCRKGPFMAEVKDIDVIWEEVAEEFGDFQVR